MSFDKEDQKIYGVPYRTRALAPVKGDKENIRFFVGTCSLRDDNEVHLVEIQKSEAFGDKIKCVEVFNHQEEIWQIAPCPTNEELFFTAHSSSDFKDRVGSLWKIEGKEIKKLMALDSVPGLRQILWDPSEMDEGTIISLHEGSLNVWDIEKEDNWASSQKKKADFGLSQGTKAIWNPHFNEEIATLNGKSINFWDLRTMKETMGTDSAHSQAVRDLDFNNNKPYHFVSGGDDAQIKFWDSRKLNQPITQIQGHSHWVWNVKYHDNLDQLLISSGSDEVVKLWNMNSLSSNSSSLPRGGGSTWDKESVRSDSGLVKIFDDHEESVYGLSWTSAMDVDTWTFVSLSYDGRLVCHQVPQEEKYKILLCDAGDGDLLSDDDLDLSD
mmetsp:Transcript_17335/g.27079  ORF Transcript_17335/g.27079 Transcript_17335/m.27079 type:complete len:383 (-) Transcript_17335:94-1242(-)|eukprot:CAMPEP_0201522752 /NCGR_PEP_ID=MMETSP0161_2-20130828/18528_1 /ASSEMBLY_ACC=CAM_ASM_000251 /TAXON_ID=180227 /ORGANISM="Neoparamoeba aestuarina, Strain SoJaBio B1-5/56/2" /LENGTH=382 /DNA_ID=CAMNT_0047921679 /DNA_START=106 /DNA_END=1254 /DNA_ORIENTATION=-